MSSSGEESEGLTGENWPEKRVLSMTYEDESSDVEEPEEDSPAENRPSTPPKKAKAPPSRQKVPLRLKNPPFIEMIVEAVEDIRDGRKGVTVPAIKASMRSKHSITEASMKTHFKKQLAKAVENGTLIRPQQYKDSKGLVGRFKINPDYVKAKLKADEKVKKSKESSQKKPTAAKMKKTPQRAPTKRRPNASDVNTEKLTSLKETSAAAKAAKEKIKKARKSIGLSNPRKPKAAPKKKTMSSTKKGTSGETRVKSKSADKRTTKTVAPEGGESSKAEKLGKPKPKKTSQKKKKVNEKK